MGDLKVLPGAAPTLTAEQQAIVDALTKEHEEVCFHVSPKFGLFVFRPPALDEWEDMQTKFEKGQSPVARRELAQRCLVHGTLENLQAYFQRKPAVATGVANELAILAGMVEEVTIKKE